jgi:hypothetical protein
MFRYFSLVYADPVRIVKCSSKIFGRAFNLPGHTNFNNIWNLLQKKTLKFQTDMDCSLEFQEKIEEETNDTENRVLHDISSSETNQLTR